MKPNVEALRGHKTTYRVVLPVCDNYLPQVFHGFCSSVFCHESSAWCRTAVGAKLKKWHKEAIFCIIFKKEIVRVPFLVRKAS